MTDRRKLPTERKSITHRFLINARVIDSDGKAGVVPIKGYITIGLYEDGTPGELFCKMDQQGSQVSGFVDAWAISVSFLLQMGMSLTEIVGKFKGSRFEPSGMTDNPDIRIALSPIDYITRWLEGRFVDRELWAETAPSMAEALKEPETCAKCGQSRMLRLSFGRMVCDPCAKGFAPERTVAP